MLERRMSLLRELQNTGMADAIVVKLMGKQPVTRAACRAGLHQFLAVEKCAPGSFTTLANANVILLGVGKDPPAAFKTNGGSPEQEAP
jgi:hypothetical protein